MMREAILGSLRADGVGDVLQQWRTKAITILLYAVSVAALPTVVSGAILSRDRREMTVVMLLIYALVAITAVYKRCDYRLRGWVIITAGYAMAINSFVPLGLAGSGRSYLIVLPIIAFILIGIRAGWIATAVSFLVYGSLILLAYTGAWRTGSNPCPTRST